MNRFFVLATLLFFFLSCGNSTSGGKDAPAGNPNTPVIHTGLSAEQEKLAAKIDTFFSKLHNRGAFNGSVLVAKAGRVIYHRSLGLSDKRKDIPLNDTSMFQLASVSKVLTATAVLMLHERGVIDINRGLNGFFTDFPYPDVTIKDLLNHRSGLPNYIYCLNDQVCRRDYRMTNAAMYSSIVERKPTRYLRPDRRFNYCNTNYALLALLVEKVTGRSFNAFVQEEIFDPIGMRNTTTILDVDLEAKNVTKPYDHRWRPVAFDASDYVLGDKSVYSTPYDLFLFSEALYQNKLISPETQQLAYTPYSKERRQTNYGLGWRLKHFRDSVKKEVYHNGWWHGYRSSFHRRLHDTITVVILSNKLNSDTYQSHRVLQIIDNAATAGEADVLD